MTAEQAGTAGGHSGCLLFRRRRTYLNGLLAKVRDLGLGLISVRRLDPDETGNGRSNEVLRPGS